MATVVHLSQSFKVNILCSHGNMLPASQEVVSEGRCVYTRH